MSTNNNRQGKEVRPLWKSAEFETKKLTKLSGSRMAALMQNKPSDVTAMTLSGRSIEKMEDLDGFAENLSRLDLSDNQISRLSGMINLKKLSMLNLSSNKFSGDAGLEDLRYLEELRMLNIGKNPNLKSIRSHLMKPLVNLQALICNECGMDKLSFIRFLPKLNTLVASYNSLKEFPIKEMGLFRFLSKISLGHNSLTEIPDLSSVVDLNELRLNHNKIDKISDAFINSRNAQSIKCLDLSNNLIADWDDARKLASMKNLTNLSFNNNKLPTKPWDSLQSIREDISADTLPLSEEEILYRRHMLLLFQRKVGVAEKDFIQLIVLDNRRVKMKWTQGGVSASNSTSVITNKILNKDKPEDWSKKQNNNSISSSSSGGSSGIGGISSIFVAANSKPSKSDKIGGGDAYTSSSVSANVELGKRPLDALTSRNSFSANKAGKEKQEGDDDDDEDNGSAQNAKKSKNEKKKKKEKKEKKSKDEERDEDGFNSIGNRNSNSNSNSNAGGNEEDVDEGWADFTLPTSDSYLAAPAPSAPFVAVIPDKLQSALQKFRVGMGSKGSSAWD